MERTFAAGFMSGGAEKRKALHGSGADIDNFRQMVSAHVSLRLLIWMTRF
jgi:hypothetical protein